MQESTDQNLPTQETVVSLYPCGMTIFCKIVVASTINLLWSGLLGQQYRLTGKPIQEIQPLLWEQHCFQ